MKIQTKIHQNKTKIEFTFFLSHQYHSLNLTNLSLLDRNMLILILWVCGKFLEKKIEKIGENSRISTREKQRHSNSQMKQKHN